MGVDTGGLLGLLSSPLAEGVQTIGSEGEGTLTGVGGNDSQHLMLSFGLHVCMKS